MLVCHSTCKSSIGTCASWSLDVHEVTAVESSTLAVALQHGGLQQEEADAVAALLAAASGLSSEDMNASTPDPSGSSLPPLCKGTISAVLYIKRQKSYVSGMGLLSDDLPLVVLLMSAMYASCAMAVKWLSLLCIRICAVLFIDCFQMFKAGASCGLSCCQFLGMAMQPQQFCTMQAQEILHQYRF